MKAFPTHTRLHTGGTRPIRVLGASMQAVSTVTVHDEQLTPMLPKAASGTLLPLQETLVAPKPQPMTQPNQLNIQNPKRAGTKEEITPSSVHAAFRQSWGVTDAAASLLQLPQAHSSHNSSRSSSTEPAHEAEPAVGPGKTGVPDSKARHNATERRRVQKLKDAFTELHTAIRERPDLVDVPPHADSSTGNRKRSRDDDGGGRNGPSHLQTLQDSADTVRQLYAIIDRLRNANGSAQTMPELLHASDNSDTPSE